MRIQSEGLRNAAQSSCAKSSTISTKFSNTNACGNKPSLKQDASFRIILKNANELPPGMGCCSTSWKHKRLRHMILRFQADTTCLVETKINPALTPHTFSVQDKLFGNKESVTMLLHNKQEHLGIRQQGRVLTGTIGQATSTALLTGCDPTGLGRWNYHFFTRGRFWPTDSKE